jgi:3D (Asp-Asp-Asp) domain-containing protein
LTPLGLLAAATLAQCSTMTVTMYSAEQFPGAAYTGERPIVGQTAAASWNIPTGTLVWVEGLGQRTINDRGSGLGSTGHVDIFVATTAEARAFGRQRLDVCR